jgi:hypothetical protein
MFDGVFINLGPPSKVSIKEANSDIRAILDTGVTFCAGVEGVFKGKLPDVKGYEKVRDRSTEGRANVFCYVRANELPKFKFIDMHRTFDREPGRPGQHPARSFVHFNFRRVQFTIAHHPPAWPGTGPARAEHLVKLRHHFAPWTNEAEWDAISDHYREIAKRKPRALLWDRNMTMPAFRKFAESCDAWAVGERIDCLMGRNLVVMDSGYQRKFDSHSVHTDHPWGAFHVRFRIPKR